MKTSTNALTARYCAQQGLPCETVQTTRGPKRHDAFGIADSLVLAGENAVLVQNCSYGTLKSHQDAIDSNPHRKAILAAGLVLECWEWRRKKLKRGGVNKGREWYVRWARAFGKGWTPVSEWSDPLDLYPKKEKA